ncbi:MAG: arginine--tRNA ligase [Oscillospiraceae bacterium]
MSKIVKDTENQLRLLIKDAIKSSAKKGELPETDELNFIIEIPADRSNGDYSSNIAFAGAKVFKMAPRKIAEIIAENIDLKDSYFSECTASGAGFLNFNLADKFYADILLDIKALGSDYGKSDYGKGEKINVEFVSANPTGPMHMGNARGGALGDCLASVLDMAGFSVYREFYINDAGNQIDKFALSLDVRYKQIYLGEDAMELPEDSYHGEDIKQRAKEFAEINGDSFMSRSEDERRNALISFALPKNIQSMKDNLSKYRIEYDKWFNESELHNSGEISEVIDMLTKNGKTYEKDGALWYKNIEVQTKMYLEMGKTAEEIEKLELKDDVLIRANGNPTYFAADIAYHRNKLEKRNFSKAIDIWGADHHGHVARLKGALSAIGIESSRLDVVLMQLVRLTRDGEIVRMSKRTGKSITLVDLLEDIPIDAVRFLFNMREPGSQMDFDLDLALEQSSQNPVYYCQYANARICSIFKKLKLEGITPRDCTENELKGLKEPEERELIRHLAGLTDEFILAAKYYDPARITRYATTLATLFHKFYNACRVSVPDESLMQSRLLLCSCVRETMVNILTLLKITTPTSM